jgi:uncharacterized protein YjeT (DUF2065 family)
MSAEILRALALVVVIEGILPFVAPGQFRTMMIRFAQLDDRSLRAAGLASMAVGLLCLQAVKWFL